MKDQHEKIAGYRDLTQPELDLINEIKAEGERLGALCAKLGELRPRSAQAAGRASSAEELGKGIAGAVDAVLRKGGPVTAEGLALDAPGAVWADPRWVAIAQTHLQQGLMALARAVARPTTF